METAVHSKCVPVAGPIEGWRTVGKGEITFRVCGQKFSLKERSKFTKLLKGASKAIVVFEYKPNQQFPRVHKVVPNYTCQQVLQVNAQYAPE